MFQNLLENVKPKGNATPRPHGMLAPNVSTLLCENAQLIKAS